MPIYFRKPMSIHSNATSIIVDALFEMHRSSVDRSELRECLEIIRLLVLFDRFRSALISCADRSARSRCISNKSGVFVFGAAALALLGNMIRMQ